MNVSSIFKGFDIKGLIGKLEKYKYVLLIALVGVVLLLWPSGNDSKADQPISEQEISIDSGGESFSLSEFESRLEDILSQIQGAGETKVALTLKTSMEVILAEQTESSADRDTSQIATVSKGSGYTEAVVTKTVYPQFQGALIVCQGGGSADVRLQIINAVASLTGLGSDKITVVKMK